jgi:hypothetical protein
MHIGKYLTGAIIATAALMCAACGGSHDANKQAAAVQKIISQVGSAEALMVTADTTVMPNDGSRLAKITVYAIGKNNVLMANVPVALAVTSGVIASMQPTTDSSGTAIAMLSVGSDTKPRSIIVTAVAGSLTSKVQVTVAANNESDAARRSRLSLPHAEDVAGKRQGTEKAQSQRQAVPSTTGIA